MFFETALGPRSGIEPIFRFFQSSAALKGSRSCVLKVRPGKRTTGLRSGVGWSGGRMFPFLAEPTVGRWHSFRMLLGPLE